MLVARFEESHPIDADLWQAVLLRDVAVIKDGLEVRLSEWRTQFLVPMITLFDGRVANRDDRQPDIDPRLLRHNREPQWPRLAP